jgi:hypothetical protein
MPTSAPVATFAALSQLSQLSPVLMCLSELNTSAAKSTYAVNTLRRSSYNSNPNIFANILLFLIIFIHLQLFYYSGNYGDAVEKLKYTPVAGKPGGHLLIFDNLLARDN